MAQTPRVKLPVDAEIPRILDSLRTRPNLVLQAAPGTGKTTRVPPALLALGQGEVLVLEPRRLAAKMSARRVADEMGEPVGKTVGYQFRFENVTSRETRLRFLTEGMLMRRLLSDPGLRGVGTVVLDEFHERHLHGDIALAFLRELQRTTRPELRIVVMSATLDSETIAAYLGDCPIIRVAGIAHEVVIEYRPSEKYLEVQVRQAVEAALAGEREVGDLLVFLPGMGEIRRAADALTDLARAEKLAILPLHGELAREEQDRALQPSERRKVVLSTNVAETSLTIPGIRTVIDSGLARISSYSAWSGLPALRTQAVSRASATQRAGRAGRTEPGQCLRLYSRADFDGRAQFEVPEIQRAELAQTVLELKSLGIRDLAAFGWFEPPSGPALSAADELLHRLGAISRDGVITALGKKMVELPVHPRLAKLVLDGAARGVSRAGVRAAAMLSEARIEGLDFLQASERAGPDPSVKRVEDRLSQSIGRTDAKTDDPNALAKSLLAAYPDRVARKRTLGAAVNRGGRGGDLELQFSSGGSAQVESSAFTTSHEWFVVLDAGEKKHQNQARAHVQVRLLAAIEPDWLLGLDPPGVIESEELSWNEERARVESIARMSYGALVLDETRGTPSDGEAAARVLARAAIAKGGWARVCDLEQLALLRARIDLVAAHAGEGSGWTSLSDGELETALGEYALGKSKLAELADGGFVGYLVSRLDAAKQTQLSKWAPADLQLPRGRRVKIHYDAGKPPWVESRLQDFFGMTSPPSLLGGKVPLTVHLLAPNMRAVQVTNDLSGFWARVYPELRRELGRRYPRHKWPENPLKPEE